VKLLPKFAIGGGGVIIACALHQSIALQVDGRLAWIPALIFVAIAFCAYIYGANDATLRIELGEPFPSDLTRILSAGLAIGLIASVFTAMLFHARTASCAPGGWAAIGSSRAYCDDTAWVPKI
jgi:hypothetical protein